MRPRGPTELPVHKPKLLGRSVHAHHVVRSRMADEAFEPVRMRGNPVHHVAAKRASGRRKPRAVNKRILRDRGIRAFHDVLINLSTPVATDIRFKFLAVTGRTARIDHHHYISWRSHHLLVPTVAPGVRPSLLRAAV